MSLRERERESCNAHVFVLQLPSGGFTFEKIEPFGESFFAKEKNSTFFLLKKSLNEFFRISGNLSSNNSAVFVCGGHRPFSSCCSCSFPFVSFPL